MSATNYTPIQLYRTTTASATPSAGNLADGELAINLTDEKLYFKNAAGVVKLLASNTGALGTVTSVALSGGTTGLTVSGSPITSSGTITLAGTLGVANGGTGTTTQFTAGSVVFAGASGVYSQDNANLFWDDSNNRLGIGTSSPGYKLDIADASYARLTTTTYVNGGFINGRTALSAGTYNTFDFVEGSTTTAYLRNYGSAFGSGLTNVLALWNTQSGPISFGTANTERLLIDASGNVGIGTSSPADKLDVTTSARISGATALFSLWNAGSVDRYGYLYGTSSGLQLSCESGGGSNIQFLTAGSERMRISAAGNVGIGTSSPDSRLYVQHAGVAELRIGYNGNSENYYDADTQIFRAISGTERMRIDSSGNVGIGTTNPAWGRLEVVSSSTNKIRLYNTAGNGNTIDFLDQSWESQIVGSAGNLLFNTGGTTERMRIDSSGNVGIGTSSPNLPLTIGAVGTGFFGSSSLLNMYVNSGLKATIDSSGNVGLGVTPSAWLSAYRALDIGTDTSLVSQGGSTAYYFNSYRDSNGNFIYKTSAAASRYQQDGAHYWYTAPSGTAGNAISFTQAMTLSVGQKLSIGTSATDIAVAYLVTQSASDVDNIRMAEAGITSIAPGIRATGDALVFKTSGSERMRIDSSGNLGIGVTPSAWGAFKPALQIGTASLSQVANRAYLTANGYYNGTAWTYNATDFATQYFQQNGQHIWNTAPSGTAGNAISFTQAMTLDASGNLGIGTTSPGDRLHLANSGSVQVATRYVNGNTAGVSMGAASDGAAFVYQGSALPFIVYTSGTERARIDSSGNLLVGQTANGLQNSNSAAITPSAGDQVVLNKVSGSASGNAYIIFGYAGGNIGSITQSGTTAVLYNTSSDARLKHDIVDAPEASTLIDQIKVRSFKWNADDSEQRYGFIAQELVEVAPEAVSVPADEEKMMGVDYSKLVPMLVKEIQSLRARVAQLEGK